MKKRLILLTIFSVFILFGALGDERSSLAAARGRFEKGDFAYSRLLLEDFIRDYPLSISLQEARLFLALSEYQLGQKPEAMATLEKIPLTALGEESHNSVLFWKGRIHLESGEVQPALDDLLMAGDDWGSPAQALSYRILLGRAYLRAGSYNLAVSTLEPLLASSSPIQEKEALNFLVYALIQLGDWDRVISTLGTRELSPSQSLYLAEALLGQGNFAQAKNYYQNLLTADLSLSVVAYQRLFNAALEAGDLAEAQSLITEAELNLGKEPEVLGDFWRRIGIGAYRRGDLGTAENYLFKIWFRRQNDLPRVVSVYYLSRLLSETQRVSEAVTVLQEYEQLGGKLSQDALGLLAKLHLDQGDFASAAKVYRSLLETAPGDPQAGLWTYLLAWLASRQGESAQAISYLSSATAPRESENLFAQGLKLRAQELKKLGEWEDASEAYGRYLALQPADPWANAESLSIHFVQKRFALLLGEAQKNSSYLADWKATAPRAYFSHQYQYGLALVSLGRYAEASRILAELETLGEIEEKLLPYARFYRALSIFRLDGSRWAESRNLWDRIVRENPEHSLAAQSIFWSGWMSLRGSDFGAAESAFRRHATHPQAQDRSGSRYYLAKALIGQGKGEEALSTLDNLAKSSPPTIWSPNALYDRAEIFQNRQNWDQALREYASLHQRFPESPLASEGLLQRAQLLMNLERWPQAKAAYRDFRQAHPDSDFADMSFFQQALASKNAGEDFEAILILTDLIDRFPDSNYRGSALWEVAGLYEKQKNYLVARDYFKDLTEAFPSLAQSLGVEAKLRTIDLLIAGFSEEEAQLQVAVALGERTATAEGRQAMIDLSRLYIFGQGDRLDTAKSLLEEVLDSGEQDRVLIPQAQYLLGEYWYRQGELLEAGNAFYATVQMRPQDQDLSAQALLRAAEMIYLAGNPSQARTLIAALQQNFPDTIWAQQGAELLEEM
jgi:TolA-binding protein